jgi:soluble lytic murein transglycosylase-like protein
MVVTPQPASAHQAPVELHLAAPFSATVERVAAQQSLPPELIHSVIRVESNYNPFAISPKGAVGLMQLIPDTARRFGVSNPFNPVENLEGGAKYLKYLLNRYNGDYPLALAAYNAGEEAVTKYGGVPPYPETRNYVTQVGKEIAARTKAPATESKPQEQTAPADPSAPRHIVEIREPDGTVRYVSR